MQLRNKRLVAYSFLLPCLVVFTIIVIYPTIKGFYYSFTDWNGFASKINFVGLKNYSRMLKDSVFSKSVINTLTITFFNVILQNGIALILAVMIDTLRKGKAFFRSVVFIPSIISSVVIGYMWMYILNPTVGSFHFILKQIGITEKIYFLSNPDIAIFTIIGTIIWQFTGYKVLIYISGLQSIPDSIYEAAVIDGAGELKKFWMITIPLISPAITINVFLTLVNSLKIFEHIYVMTSGGPGNATETVATMIYNTAFNANQMGYGTALSSILFIAIMIIAFFQLKYMRKREVEF